MKPKASDTYGTFKYFVQSSEFQSEDKNAYTMIVYKFLMNYYHSEDFVNSALDWAETYFQSYENEEDTKAIIEVQARLNGVIQGVHKWLLTQNVEDSLYTAYTQDAPLLSINGYLLYLNQYIDEFKKSTPQQSVLGNIRDATETPAVAATSAAPSTRPPRKPTSRPTAPHTTAAAPSKKKPPKKAKKPKAATRARISTSTARRTTPQKQDVEELAETSTAASTSIASTKAKGGKLGNRWEQMMQQRHEEESGKYTQVKTKDMLGLENVDVKKLTELMEQAFNLIQQNNVFNMAMGLLKGTAQKNELKEQLKQRVDNHIAPDVTEWAAQYRKQHGSIPKELQERVTKYYCYIDGLELDNEKFARGRNREVESYGFDAQDTRYYEKDTWPDYANDFIPWEMRESPPPQDAKSCENTIKYCNIKDKVLVSLQLSLNYWEDSYNLCVELQNSNKPDISAMGHTMEKELFLGEQKTLHIMAGKSTSILSHLIPTAAGGSRSPEFNRMRMPQPKDMKAYKEEASPSTRT